MHGKEHLLKYFTPTETITMRALFELGSGITTERDECELKRGPHLTPYRRRTQIFSAVILLCGI